MNQEYFDNIKSGKTTSYKDQGLTEIEIRHIATLIELWHNSNYSEYINLNGLEFWSIHLATDLINQKEFYNSDIHFYIDAVKNELKRIGA